jgi:hypothetical protein
MTIEQKRAFFDELKDKLHEIQQIFLILRDAGNTAKQNRAITKASDELTSYENVVVANLRKTLKCEVK